MGIGCVGQVVSGTCTVICKHHLWTLPGFGTGLGREGKMDAESGEQFPRVGSKWCPQLPPVIEDTFPNSPLRGPSQMLYSLSCFLPHTLGSSYSPVSGPSRGAGGQGQPSPPRFIQPLRCPLGRHLHLPRLLQHLQPLCLLKLRLSSQQDIPLPGKGARVRDIP